MTSSLQALLVRAVDYAGLFPPARLPLDQAIRNYAHYRPHLPDGWMLGRFVCPAARLAELEPYAEELFEQRYGPFTFAALGRGGATQADWLAGLRADLEAMAVFLQQHGSRVRVDVLETRLPDDLLGQLSSAPVADFVARAGEVLAGHQLPSLTPFYEAPASREWGAVTETIVSGLRQAGGAGFKLRCGGLTADAFPSVERVAWTIEACRRHGVPLKFTAGLHHPLPRFDATVQATMHGFVNVFTAGVLAHACSVGEDVLRTLLADSDATHFAFDDAGLSWKAFHASTAEIESARRSVVLSFGSCSFDEPRDDLRALGWL
jgi:hypothetical protein